MLNTAWHCAFRHTVSAKIAISRVVFPDLKKAYSARVAALVMDISL